MRRVVALFTLYLMLIIILTSCFDAREVNDFTYVAMIGIDEGISDKWRLTFLFPSTGGGSEAKGGGGSSGSEENKEGFKYSTFTIEAPSFFEGVNLANTSIPKKLNFMHTSILVFSEDLAKSGLIGVYIAPLIRNREIRRTEHVVISRDSAKDFVEAAKSYKGSIASKAIGDLLEESGETGYFPKIKLNDLYNGIKSSYNHSIAILGAINNGDNLIQERKGETGAQKNSHDYYAGDVIRHGGDKIELMGCAIINGDKMIAKLTGQEARMVSIARGSLKRGTFTIQDPKSPDLIVPIDVRLSGKPKVKVSIQDGKPSINLKLKLEGDMLAIQSRINYEDPKLTPVLEEAVEKHIKSRLDKVIEKCKALRSDIFNFGHVGVMKFRTVQEWEAYNWNKKFENAQVNTSLEFHVRRSGTLIGNSPIISTEGTE